MTDQHFTREQLEAINEALPDGLGAGHIIALCNAIAEKATAELRNENARLREALQLALNVWDKGYVVPSASIPHKAARKALETT